ncbi:fimbrillin family protein [Parabacteroides sp.]
MRKNLAWALLAALSLTACEKEGDTDNGPVELRLSSGIEVQTKATHGLDQAFKKDETIHVWVDDAKDVQTEVAKEYLYENNELTVGETGALTGSSMYFPQTGNKVNIYALHTNATWTGDAYLSKFTHTVASDQRSSTNGYANSDLAYVGVTGVARTPSAVSLSFQHLLSKIEVVLKAGAGETGFLSKDNIDKVEILGTCLKAAVSLSKDDLKEIKEAVGSGVGTISIDTDVTAEGATTEVLNEAIIVPQTVAKDEDFIKITLKSGGEFIYKLEKETTFQSGKKYKYTITANQTGLSVDSSIENWGDGGTATGDATM